MPTKHQHNIYLYVLSLLPILLVTPARLGCGMIIVLFINLSMILGTTLRFFMNKIDNFVIENGILTEYNGSNHVVIPDGVTIH